MQMPTNASLKVLSLTAALLMMAGCDKSGSSYSLLPTSQSFSQATSTVNNKIDVLWVVDNSSSMTPLQQNLVTNFGTFINNFQTLGYDFHIAVTSTDAYLAGAEWDNDASYSVFKDGASGAETGVYLINTLTSNLVNTFVANASLGASGSGDERAFSSIKAAMSNATNVAGGFLRSDSFMAVIILSDEDDFSDPTRIEDSWLFQGGTPDHDYSDPNLETVDSYVSYLDTLTNTTAANRRYNVSAITVMDSTCLASHQPSSPSSIIGTRYMDIASATSGIVGSICDSDYASSLNAIQQQVIELSTQFYLSRTPIVSSIVIQVNGVVVPEDDTNGWSYNSSTNSITFHGTAIPAQGAAISVNFDPATIATN